jgi:hypothetical protein
LADHLAAIRPPQRRLRQFVTVGVAAAAALVGGIAYAAVQDAGP